MATDSHHFTLEDARTRSGVKWTRYDRDVIPLWVADMDYAVAPAIATALAEFVEKGEFGYTHPDAAKATLAVAAEWFERRHGVRVDAEQGVITRDVMQGVAASLAAYTGQGDGIIIHTPIYPPFVQAVAASGRRMLDCPMTADFALDLDLTEKLASGASAMLLSNPHNPTGRVLRHDELVALTDIANRNDLTIISDEIHADLVFPGNSHLPLASIPEGADRTVTIMAASKTFNIAGIGCGVVFFGSSELEKRFADVPTAIIGHPRAFNLGVSTAAWQHGEAWLADTMEVLASNRNTVSKWSQALDIPSTSPEATYLAWMDFRRFGWGEEPNERFVRDAKVALSSGIEFGQNGSGFARLNFATSPQILTEALERLGAVMATK